jgi:cyclophilin family peptidyl-prolyl cis-trans isomerase
MDIIDKIAKVKTSSSDKPKTPVRIEKAEVVE